MKFLELTNYLEQIEGISSRNEMTQVITEAFNKMNSEEISIFAYVLEGRVAPLFVPAEFNLSEKSLITLLGQYTTEKVADLRSELGDIGLVTEKVLSSKQKGKGLDVLTVYKYLWKIINVKGTGSVKTKATYVADVLSQLSPKEAKFFTRMVVGKLRIGVSVKTFIDALSVWVAGDKSLSDSINLAYGCDADLGYIAQKVYENKANISDFITALEVIPGIPLLAKLVEKVDSFEEGFDRFEGKFILQPKYDGLRCQIHKYTLGGMLFDKRKWYRYMEDTSSNFGLFDSLLNQIVVKLFSRNLEDLTEMFPEIVESAKTLPYENIVLDCEIIGWQARKEEFLSYQDTMTRRRKYSVQALQESIPVRAFVFDILFLDNESLLRKPLKERMKILSKIKLKKSKDIMLSPMSEVDNLVDMQSQFDMYVKKGLEGVVIKGLDTVYSPGVRNYDWIKIKKSINESLVDTLDLVVLGYYKGSGKRSGFGIGAILAGIYNEGEDRFESFTKVGTGITDEMFKKIFERLQPIIVKEKPKNVEVEDILVPDVWVYPEVVMTVKADEISKNRNDSKIAKGFSLRFPRLIEWDRDKSVNDIFRVEDLEK